MKIKSILSALLLMASTMASAQYLNVKLEDGTCHSYKTTPNMKVSFGDKAGADVTESEQIVTVDGHTVTVKLADDTPASDVLLHIYVEDGIVKIKAASAEGYGLECSRDDNVAVSEPAVSNGFFTFTISNIQKDMVVTVGYITVKFDMNNSGMDANFTAKPDDKKIGYSTTIDEPDRLFSDKYGFRGWYKDKECTEAWNFSTIVTKSMTLYAKWAEDPTETKINGRDFVKLGGYYWATQNVYKATGVAEKRIGSEIDGSYYTQSNSRAAATSWGGTWDLPSEAQWQILLEYCDWEWKGNGMLVKGRADNYESDHSIFLPAADFCYDASINVHVPDYHGYYWSTGSGSYLDFGDGGRSMSSISTDYGLSVRPVSE